MESAEATTRFCVSVEQMVPYLENLCNGNSEIEELVESKLASESEHSTEVEPIEDVAAPEEEYINYIDLSELNPIIEACNCLQIDDLVEGKI